MSNMSYCRFQNTLSDLQDCLDALENGAAPDQDLDDNATDDEREAAEYDLSEDEKRARDKLIALCRMIADEFGEE